MSAIHIVCSHCGGINRVPSERLGENPSCGKCHKSVLDGTPTSLGSNNFERFITKNDLPVVVDFWADWCGPCKMMAPVYEQAAAQIEPRARLAKVDTEQNQLLAQRYSIRSIPTVALFKGGKHVASQPGAMNLPQLQQWIESHL